MSPTRPVNQRAWWFVLPVLISVAFSALVPLMTIVNYSVQDILAPIRNDIWASGRKENN